jgi:hypothetical protein
MSARRRLKGLVMKRREFVSFMPEEFSDVERR